MPKVSASAGLSGQRLLGTNNLVSRLSSDQPLTGMREDVLRALGLGALLYRCSGRVTAELYSINRTKQSF